MTVCVFFVSFFPLVGSNFSRPHVRLVFSVQFNKISASPIGFLKSATERNAKFDKHKPALLAFRLACRNRKWHLANELWDVLAIKFLLPLYVK